MWKNGKPWKGERFLIDEPGYVMVVENGKDVQKLAKYVMTDSKPQTASTKKTATQYEVICSACYGTGTIEGRGRWVDETKQSRILAGSKGYMEGYTHYEWETGNKVYVSGTSVQCSKCNGKGRYFQ